MVRIHCTKLTCNPLQVLQLFCILELRTKINRNVWRHIIYRRFAIREEVRDPYSSQCSPCDWSQENQSLEYGRKPGRQSHRRASFVRSRSWKYHRCRDKHLICVRIDKTPVWLREVNTKMSLTKTEIVTEGCFCFVDILWSNSGRANSRICSIWWCGGNIQPDLKANLFAAP